MTDIMISARNLAKTYGFGAKKVEAVRGLDLEVRRGEIFGLVGPDGAQAPYIRIQRVAEIPKTTSGKAPLIKAYRAVTQDGV